MLISQAKTFCVFFLIVFLLNACSGNKNANVNSSASDANQTANSIAEIHPQDDVEELVKIVKLPFTPVEATYSEFNLSAGEPNKKRLVVILRFSAADADQIAANAEKYRTPAPADIDAENWFPPELIAKSQETGDGSLKSVEYAANDFLQPPYTDGRLTRINDTDYFVLEMY